MKTRLILVLGLLALLLGACGKINHYIIKKNGPLSCGLAETADDFTFSNDGSTYGRAFARAPEGPLFAAGFATDSKFASRGIVRRSTDNGKNWKTIDDFNGPGKSVRYTSMTTGPDSKVFVGTTVTEKGEERTGVRYSNNHGDNWVYVPYEATKYPFQQITAVALDSHGELFGAIAATDKKGDTIWLVMKSLKTSDVFKRSTDGRFIKQKPAGMVIDKNDNVFVAGSADDGNGVSHWVVRASFDKGANWNIIDNYGNGADNAMASSIMIDGSGIIYVTGRVVDYMGNRWVVRRSTDGGTQWDTVSDYRYQERQDSSGKFLIDLSGAPLAVGYGSHANSGIHWTARLGRNNGLFWNLSDDFQYAGHQQSVAYGGGAGNLNDAFVIGDAIDDTNRTHWIVRRLADCQ